MTKVALALFTFLSLPALASSTDLPNFQIVKEGAIYRGAQPRGQGLRELKEMGVKTIINLRRENPESAEAEEKMATKLGMQFKHFPMTAYDVPQDQQINQILETLVNPAAQPVFVHCMFGKDRTGLVIALHRVLSEKWNPKLAYEEMLSYGFDIKWEELSAYYTKRTGYQP